MIIINILFWPVLKLTETFRIHQILCFLVAITSMQYVAGQWKAASETCLSEHNKLSSEITFMANCPKAKGEPDADDQNDKKKHQCFMMRRHCAKKCKGTDNTCPATSLFTLNLKVNKQTKVFESVECICSYSAYISSCTGEYTDTWSDVEKEFNKKCTGDTTTSTSTTTTTVASKKECPKLTAFEAAGNVYYDKVNSNDKVDHGKKASVSCNYEMLVCPEALPANCSPSASVVTCEDGAWTDFVPFQCVPDMEKHCPSLRGKMIDDKCLTIEQGLRDISAERQCEEPGLVGGQLMTQRDQAELTELAEHFQYKRTQFMSKDSNILYQLFVSLNENLTKGQKLRFKGHTPNKIIEGKYETYGRKEISEFYQHSPLRMTSDIRPLYDYIRLERYLEGDNGKVDLSNSYRGNISPSGLKENEPFDITIDNTDTEFVITTDGTEKRYPYVNRTLRYVNTIIFEGREFKLESATLDGKPLRLGDEDKYYTDCLVVGLTNGKSGWIWDDGSPLAEADKALWDTDQPDITSGDEQYACLNVMTKKLRAVSSLLKRYVICEYENQTKARTVKERKKREISLNGKSEIYHEAVKSLKQLNREL